MADKDDLSGAVEALFTSAEWEQRLAEARESRRKVLATKDASKPPPSEPEDAPDAPAKPRAALSLAAALTCAAVVGGVVLGAAALIWPRLEDPLPQPLRHAVTASYAPIPLSFAIAEVPALPMRFAAGAPDAPPVDDTLSFGLEGDIPDDVMSAAIAPERDVTLVPVAGDLPLATVPPPSMQQVYADLLARLRAASGDAPMRVHLPPGADAVRDDLRAVTSRFAAPADVVRFFHAQDGDTARDAAAAIGAQAQDFTDYAPTPPRGTLEVWLSAR